MMETIRQETRDQILHISLARPGSLNAISRLMMSEMGAVLDAAAHDDHVKAIVLSGEGRAFCAGYDMKESASFVGYGVEEWQAEFDIFRAFILSFWSHPKPTVSAVHGHCVGGGMDLALACDLTIASADSLFGMPEARNGAGLPMILMPWLAPPKFAKEIVLGGRTDHRPEKLMPAGLINEIVKPGQHVARAIELAKDLAKGPTTAISQVKRAINRAYEVRGMMSSLEADAAVATLVELAVTPERSTFNQIRDAQGLKAALEWRAR